MPKKFDENVKKQQFVNTHKVSNCDINKFILLLRKVVCPYEFINDLEKIIETLLWKKEDFHSHLNMEYEWFEEKIKKENSFSPYLSVRTYG